MTVAPLPSSVPVTIRVRHLPEVRDTDDLVWFRPALDRVRTLPNDADRRRRTFFSSDAPIFVARAPGRLDVMGGIADYSGARVLELPLACTTSVVLQAHVPPRVDIATRRESHWRHFSLDLPPVVDPRGELGTPAALAGWFAAHAHDRWAGYVIGMLQLMAQRAARDGRPAPPGYRILVDSTVPAGRGVASSAALEVAAGAVLAAACGDDMSATELAASCQSVENHVVGAPCGIMDQMTSACGRRDRLLQLRCQPGTIEGYLRIPDGFRVYGIDSGISHAVSGADYGTVRTAAFMGYRMIAAAAGLPAVREGARVQVGDTRWGGYLANLTLEEYTTLGRDLPEELPGEEFLRRYDGITDSATVVQSGRRYPVRRATEHPVGEQARVDRFTELLNALAERPLPRTAEELGQLMYESHRSYGACGLGSHGTDRLVELVAARGPERGLFGAKITGGGSGGTVAVLGTSAAEPVVREIAERYREETGHRASVFTGSGPGAAETGVLRLNPRELVTAAAV
jgi:galactokinase